MSIAAAMAKKGYMPKARKNRESKDVYDFKQTEPAVEDPTVEEESKEIAANPAASAASKAASAMWLKNRMPPKLSQPGTSNSDMATMTGSRYGTSTSLPYKNPGLPGSSSPVEGARSPFAPKISAKGRGESKGMDKADMDRSTSKHKNRKDFMKFIMNTQANSRPKNRLVRQCTHCQMLYSSSHVCRASAQPDNLAIENK